MNEVIKQMQKRIVEGIQLPDKKQQNQLRKDVEQALQESIKDLAEHGGGPKAEDRFWKRLEHIAAKEPKNRIIYQHYQDISYFWQYTENWYSCYPPNLSEEEREKSLCAVEIERPDSEKYGSYLTAFLPCDSEGLKKFFGDNGIDMKNCDIGEIYCGSETTNVLTENFEKLPREEVDVFQLNELFCRFDKLPEEMQRVYGLTLPLKEPRTVKEMIDLMDHLSEVCVVNGIQNERQLGEFWWKMNFLMFHFLKNLCHIWITQKSAGNICRHMKVKSFMVCMWRILLIMKWCRLVRNQQTKTNKAMIMK